MMALSGVRQLVVDRGEEPLLHAGDAPQLLVRPLQLAGALGQRLVQAGVADADRDLRGEGGEQADVAVARPVGAAVPRHQRADRLAEEHERGDDHGAGALGAVTLPPGRGLVPASEDGRVAGGEGTDRCLVARPEPILVLQPEGRHRMEAALAIGAVHDHVMCREEGAGEPRHQREELLRVERAVHAEPQRVQRLGLLHAPAEGEALLLGLPSLPGQRPHAGEGEPERGPLLRIAPERAPVGDEQRRPVVVPLVFAER
jgi:hypothetical protein